MTLDPITKFQIAATTHRIRVEAATHPAFEITRKPSRLRHFRRH